VRLFDAAFASLALLFTSPVILIGALAVKLSSPGPAFYRAKRAGRGGKPFVMFKLRTMYVNTDAPDRRVTGDRDDRITPVGRLLRKFRIDELPQFWNVLRGDMSVVGPRPEDWDIVERTYTPAQRRVLEARPGIVSPADVRWYPDMTYHDPPPPGVPIQEHYIRRHLPAKLAEELRYIERRTLLLDIGVIFQTVYCVLVRSWLLPERRPLQPTDSAPSAG
jgi:lipopolysaccharide/colanic/teichoic acid biosynthesis glycosyltransferase